MMKYNVDKLTINWINEHGEEKTEVINSKMTIYASETNMGLFYDRKNLEQESDAIHAKRAIVDWEKATPHLTIIM